MEKARIAYILNSIGAIPIDNTGETKLAMHRLEFPWV